MKSLIYNPTTAKHIEKLRGSLPHAVLLHGEHGVGLFSLAADIAGNSLCGVVHPTDKTDMPDPSGTIKIDQIRRLYNHAKGKSTTGRVYIINDADRMVVPAQHALLKLLEEPTNHTHFVLTAHAPNKLLSTIMSRVQQIRIPTISLSQSKMLLDDLSITQPEAVKQILFLASGRPALIKKYAADPALLATKASCIADARLLIQGKMPEKLRVIQHYSVDRHTALSLLESAIAIVEYSLGQHPKAAHVNLVERLVRAYDRIAANGTVRLNLLLIVL